MSDFLLKVKEDHRANHNIYIIQSNAIVKVGYTSNLQVRMLRYYYHNPNTVFIGSTFREDAEQFEKELHASVQSVILNEWYPASMLELLIEYVTNQTELPTGWKLRAKIPKKKPSTKGARVGKAISPATQLKRDCYTSYLTTTSNPTFKGYCICIPEELRFSSKQFSRLIKGETKT